VQDVARNLHLKKHTSKNLFGQEAASLLVLLKQQSNQDV